MKLNVKVTKEDLAALEAFKQQESYLYAPQAKSNTQMFLVNLWTQVHYEIRRNLRVFNQNIFSPIFSTFIYFLVFGTIMGSQIGSIGGVSYTIFLVPGFMMMPVVSHSFSNGCFSTYFKIFTKLINDVVRSPVSIHNFLLAVAIAGMLRGLVVALVIWLTSILFTHSFYIAHPLMMILLICFTGATFALVGCVSGAIAKSFDTTHTLQNFVIVPLTYLSGTFYDVNELPNVFKVISYFNPFTYIVDLLRQAYLGTENSNAYFGFFFLALCLASAYYLAVKIFNRKLNIQ